MFISQEFKNGLTGQFWLGYLMGYSQMSAKTAVILRLHWAGGSASKVAHSHECQIGAGHLENLGACLCGPLHKAPWISFHNMAAGFPQSEWPKSSK